MKERVLAFDILKIISIYLVVIIHICTIVFGNYNVQTVEWQVLNAWDSIAHISVPIFFMVSGALLLNDERSRSIDFVLKHRVINVVRIYILWDIFYTIWSVVKWSIVEGFRMGFLKSAAVEFMKGHYHMWFLVALVGLYLLLPILKIIVDDVSIEKYFIFLCIGLCTIPTTIAGFHVIDQYFQIFNNLYLNFGYVTCFVLGHYLYRYYKTLSGFAFFCAGVGCWIFTMLLTRYLSEGAINSLFYDPLKLNILIPSMAIFIVCIKIVDKYSSSINGNYIKNLEGYVLPIYLLHPIILETVQLTGKMCPISLIPFYAFLVCMVCIILSRFLLLIPGSKFFLKL